MLIFKTHEALTYISPYFPQQPIIVEAGAFNGSDTVRMADFWPHAQIHAFEPVPELHAALQKRTAAFPTIHCYELALSDHDGSAELFVSEKPNKPGKPSQGNSLLAPKERLHYSNLTFPKTISVPTITLDSWARQNTIDHVDLLWLDMQGHELAVLEASKK